VDIWERIAEAKIQEAIQNGEFTVLDGFGRPGELDFEEYDEHWWVRRKLRVEGIRIRLDPSSILSGTPTHRPDEASMNHIVDL
jgi:Domain of unknown function (DUF1992)